MMRKAVAAVGAPAAGISIRDLQLTGKVRLATAMDDLDAVRAQTSVTSVHYFRKAYAKRLSETNPTAVGA